MNPGPSGNALSVQGQTRRLRDATERRQSAEQSAIDGITGAQGPSGNVIGGYFPFEQDVAGMPTPGQFNPGRQRDDAYYDGDEFRLIQDMPLEEYRRLQDFLVSVGLADDIYYGERGDPETISGFSRLLGMANASGEGWERTRMRFERLRDTDQLGPNGIGTGGGRGGGQMPERPGFVGSEYLPPDPAEINGSIRDLAEKLTPDVDLDDQQVDELRDTFLAYGRQQHEASQAWARSEFEANLDAGETGDDQTVSGPDVPNTAARFREHFEEKFKPNIDRRESAEQEVDRRQVTDANLSNLMQLATGGR